MRAYTITILLNHSIIIAAAIGLIRFRSIAPIYYPFIFLVWLGFANETLSLILIYTIRNNTVNSNIYVLIEYLLILFQFYKWNGNDIKRYYFFAAIGLMVWIADNLIINSVTGNNSLFRIFNAVIITLFSIDLINKLIINDKRSLLKNAMFLICSTFLIYYSCKAFVEVFNAFHLELGNEFNRSIFMILYGANLLSNIVYPIAILCMPAKQEFTLPY